MSGASEGTRVECGGVLSRPSGCNMHGHNYVPRGHDDRNAVNSIYCTKCGEVKNLAAEAKK